MTSSIPERLNITMLLPSLNTSPDHRKSIKMNAQQWSVNINEQHLELLF